MIAIKIAANNLSLLGAGVAEMIAILLILKVLFGYYNVNIILMCQFIGALNPQNQCPTDVLGLL
jgi:hypothetical protein